MTFCSRIAPRISKGKAKKTRKTAVQYLRGRLLRLCVRCGASNARPAKGATAVCAPHPKTVQAGGLICARRRSHRMPAAADSASSTIWISQP